MLEDENKSDNKTDEGGFKIFSVTLFILIFSLIVIVFIYENIKTSKLSKNGFLNRIFNYFEKKTTPTGTRDTTFINDSSVATIFNVELNYELNGTEDFPQLFIDGVNNESRGYLLKLLIQIGRRLTGKYVVSSLDKERKASTRSSNANANANNVNGNGKGTSNDPSSSFYSLIDIELKTTSFSSPIPVRNFSLLVPNHLYDLRILTHKDHDEDNRDNDDDDDDDAVDNKIVYDKILYQGSVRLKINLFNFKPLLITKDAILLYDRLKPFKSVDDEEKDKNKDVYVSYPESIFKKKDYIENFPNLRPVAFPAAHKPLNLQRGCKFLSEVRVLSIDNDEESGDKDNNTDNIQQSHPPPPSSSSSPSSFSSSFYIEYDEKDVSEGKTSVIQNPNNELEYYVFLLKDNNHDSDQTFPRGWSLSYKSESNGAVYEQIYTLDTILKSGHEKEILIKNQKLMDVISENHSSLPRQNFKVNNLALDHCVGITYDSLTPKTFKLLAPSPPPTKGWFEQSPFLGVSMKTGGGLIYATHFINSSTCHKSLFRGSFSPEDSSLFFLNKRRGHPVSCHPINRHFCKANSSSSSSEDSTTTTTGGGPLLFLPDHLEIMALVSKSHNPMPLLSLSPSSAENNGNNNNIDSKQDLMKIAPFPFFTQSVTNPYNSENFQSSSAAVGITVTEHYFNLPHIRYTLLNGDGGSGSGSGSGSGDVDDDERDRAAADAEEKYYVYNVPYPKFEYRHAISPSYTPDVISITREFFLNGQTRSIKRRRTKKRRGSGVVYGIPSAPHSPRSAVQNDPSYLYLAWWTKPFTPDVAKKIMGKQTRVRFEDVTSGSFFNSNLGAALITDKWAAYSSSVLKITNEHQFLNVEFSNGPLIGQKAQVYFLMTLTPVYRLSSFFFYSIQDTIMKNPSISETEEKEIITEGEGEGEGVSYVLAVFQRQRSGKNLLVLIFSCLATLHNYETFNKNPPSGYIGPLKPKEMYYLRLNDYIREEKLLEYSTNCAILLMSFAEYLHYIQCIDKDDIGKVYKKCLKSKFYPNGLCFIPRHHYEKFVDLISYK